ncbi:MAG TPA: hydrogenase maturation nickel metallochaperone HypA [Gammaproteobacteria bacterium]|nr:hydrogenase maturation nickel metallochaperone HypA [Gammaproteobacteria bacterium]
MHELSVCQALVTQLETVSAANGGGAVELVRLRIGPLSGVEASLLRQAFPLAAAGTIAADAELVIEAAAVVVQCNECGARTDAAPNRMLCGACNGYRVRLVSGNEMLLESVELATATAAPAALS